MSIPSDAAKFPFRAVLGWESCFNPRIKRTAEIKYRTGIIVDCSKALSFKHF